MGNVARTVLHSSFFILHFLIMTRWHSCNVLHVGAEGRQLWQFDARNGSFALSRGQVVPPDGDLPAHQVLKSWRSLWQPRLNVAWLPPGSVFLRVVHLPKSSAEETHLMVEFQLEKLSPIPVTQVVWSVHSLAGTAGDQQTLIVVFAERKAVEEFLGQLEGQGYLADRLELKVLDQLLATPINEDGAWIYPSAWGGDSTAVVAWWYGGVLQNLNFLTLPAVADRAGRLKEQLTQMAWAGELEGWLTSPPAWHLVGDEAAVREWEPALRQGLDQPLVISAPLGAAELAALTAKRAAQTDPKSEKGGLLPAEFATRYRQQFVDRLWGRGLLAAGAVYLVAIAIYFIALSYQLFRVNGVERDVKNLSLSYTNAIQLRDRYKILQERQELKFAALDCWKKVAELMPETMQLDGFNLVDGRKLSLNGSVPTGQVTETLDFVKAMRKATLNGQPMFDESKPEGFITRPNPDKVTSSWSFNLELLRGEAK